MVFMMMNWTKKQKRLENKVFNNKINNHQKVKDKIYSHPRKRREKCEVIHLSLI